MALDYNRFAGSLLSSLGSGLMGAGSGGWNQFAPAFAQGQQMFDQQQQQRLTNEETRKLRELQQEQLQMQIEQQRTANQDRVKQQQAFEQLLGGGLMSPNGMSQAQFGGAPMQPGLMSQNFDPNQLAFLKAMGPDAAPIIGEQLFKTQEPQKGIEIGGVLVNPITGEKIADFSDVIRKNAAAGRAQTTVNVGPSGIDYGDPEAGLAWARNPDGTVRLDERGAPIAVPYQGSKAYNEMVKGEQSAVANEAAKQQTASIVTEDIDRALDLVDSATLPTTGFAGPFLSNIGGTAANDVRALVETVKANVGFDKLQAMRMASPTGGALGQVSDFENRNLQAVIGNLEQSQTPEQFKANLKRVKEVYLDIIHGPGNRPGSAKETTSEFVRDPVTGKLVRKK